ncbi:MAG: hypothetical protein JO362_12065 [Streptomycetaceae bacterium]|nr:hypothetical protein [Streptomycetaceae bacterium]
MSQNSLPAGRIDRDGICTAYEQTPRSVDAWIRLPNFPAPVAEGQWDARQVDDWIRANRPQCWPAKAAVDAAIPAQKPAAPAKRATPTKSQDAAAERLLGKSCLADRYRMSYSAVDSWTKIDGFPAPAEPGKWRGEDVDDWVKELRPHVWAELTESGPLVVIAPPEGNTKDLYDLTGYGVILGNATRGRPLPRTTMLSYKNSGHLEPPDRRPGDRKRPEVFELMWFLETITRHVYSRRGQGRTRVGRVRGSKGR